MRPATSSVALWYVRGDGTGSAAGMRAGSGLRGGVAGIGWRGGGPSKAAECMASRIGSMGPAEGVNGAWASGQPHGVEPVSVAASKGRARTLHRSQLQCNYLDLRSFRVEMIPTSASSKPCKRSAFTSSGLLRHLAALHVCRSNVHPG